MDLSALQCQPWLTPQKQVFLRANSSDALSAATPHFHAKCMSDPVHVLQSCCRIATGEAEKLQITPRESSSPPNAGKASCMLILVLMGCLSYRLSPSWGPLDVLLLVTPTRHLLGKQITSFQPRAQLYKAISHIAIPP
jgi:hypothetical protein